ncbi:MAG: polyphosphate:AMP phosphotransferase [Cephaloticoccus sp.]|nr:polyphosphate:AMP phosphotransferase [Cephaloticoccus sp.]MCF7761567.1 polyphosphate:AMP phosphotransferase [Cephaloticoccus sp.]
MAKKGAKKTKLTKKEYEARVPILREQLIKLQVQLKSANFPVLLVIAGVEATGKGEVINTLNGWIDPRGVEVFAFHPPTDEERARPTMWRYWRCLTPRGRIGVYAGSWYTEALREASIPRTDPKLFRHALHRIEHFERLLVADGALVVKCWLHLSKADQGARLKKLAGHPRTAWRVTTGDWQSHRAYKRIDELGRTLRRETGRTGARWTVIDAADERTRNVAVTTTLLDAFAAHVKQQPRNVPQAKRRAITPLRPEGLKKLAALPLDQHLTAPAYEEKRDKWLGKLNRLVRQAAELQRSVVFVFEGWDAAGKGGAIRRLTSAIDARDCRVIPVAKPTDEEKAHHYLWRFWRHIPRDGTVTIYDRSWYGRVLVERLEGFAREDEWRRAYTELNDFEQQLTEHGTIVVKFWLHISKAEQLRRFRHREETEYKRHKINAEDWRNRRKWRQYEIAVGDMLLLTRHAHAPWHLVAAENKRHARLQVLKLSCHQIETALAET